MRRGSISLKALRRGSELALDPASLPEKSDGRRHSGSIKQVRKGSSSSQAQPPSRRSSTEKSSEKEKETASSAGIPGISNSAEGSSAGQVIAGKSSLSLGAARKSRLTSERRVHFFFCNHQLVHLLSVQKINYQCRNKIENKTLNNLLQVTITGRVLVETIPGRISASSPSPP